MISYGEENFTIELLESFESTSRQEEIDKEAYWIEKLDTFNNGYNNVYKQGYTAVGIPKTEEEKRRLSERFSGENNPMYGKKLKDYMSEDKIKEWKNNMSKSRKGKKFSESHKKALSENNGKKKKCYAIINGEEKEFDSLTKLSKYLEVGVSTVSRALKLNKTIKGIKVYYK